MVSLRRICPNQKRDFPGIISYEAGKELLFDGKELSRDEKSVRGTFVTGLSESDILFLDRFEGEGFVGCMSLAR